MSASPKKLRMDRSRPFGTVHGERLPGDKSATAHFTQDGICFDAQGLHIDDLVEDEKVRALVDRKLKKAAKPAGDAGGSDETDDDPGETKAPGSDSAPDDVNLEAWLRGEAKYPWFAITKRVRERYSQNISKQIDMIEFLVMDEKVIPLDQLDPALLDLIGRIYDSRGLRFGHRIESEVVERRRYQAVSGGALPNNAFTTGAVTSQ